MEGNRLNIFISHQIIIEYKRRNWRLLADYLNFQGYINTYILNSQIIDDAYHFMTTGEYDYSIFFSIMNHLSPETNYTAWWPMLKIFEYLSHYFPFEESTFF